MNGQNDDQCEKVERTEHSEEPEDILVVKGNNTPENSFMFNGALFDREDITYEDWFVYVTMCYLEQKKRGSSLSAVLQYFERMGKNGIRPRKVKRAYYHLQELGIKPVTRDQAAVQWRTQMEVER